MIHERIRQIFGRKPPREPSAEEAQENVQENLPLDRDREGKPLYKEDILSYIDKELEWRKTERQPLELQWQLNSNFLIGNQYCDVNLITGTVESYEAPQDWMQHEPFNQIAPLIETRLAHLQKVSYDMTVRPRTSELDDYNKAQVSTMILQYLQSQMNFTQTKNTAISWAETTGSAFFLTWWDPTAGELVSPQADTREGDIKWGVLTPYEVYPESIFKEDVEDQRSIIIDQVFTVDEIYDIYGVEVEGTNVDVTAMSPNYALGGYGYMASVMALTSRQVENAQHVTTFFERSSRTYPNGRMAVKIGEELIYYGVLPYGSYPIVMLRSKLVPGQFFGRSVIQDLIPLQRAYNGVKNNVHDYIKYLAIGGYIAEEGSIDADDYAERGAEPGGILTYRRGTEKPSPRTNVALPNSVQAEMAQLRRDMEYVSGVSQLMMVGGTPSGVTSGTAIDSLTDIDNMRMSLSAEIIREGVRRLAIQWLQIYKRFTRGYRVLNITGMNNIGAATVWTSEDINSYDVIYNAENELKYSEENQKATFMAAYNMGLFSDENGIIPQKFKIKALEHMKIGNYSEMLSEHELQSQNARRENDFFAQGIIPQIDEFDDDEVHIEEHKKHVLQYQFRIQSKKNPELAELFRQHVRSHEQRLTQAKLQQQLAMMQQLANQNQKK